MSSRIIIGIDPGLATTGWGILQVTGENMVYVDSGSISTAPALPTGQRLTKIFDGLQSVVKKYDVRAGAVESGFVGKSAQSALKLGQARATAILALEQLGISVTDLTPREIKLSVTGRGSAVKEQVGYMVGKMLRLEFDKGEEDISDALAVAICLTMQSSRRRLADVRA